MEFISVKIKLNFQSLLQSSVILSFSAWAEIEETCGASDLFSPCTCSSFPGVSQRCISCFHGCCASALRPIAIALHASISVALWWIISRLWGEGCETERLSRTLPLFLEENIFRKEWRCQGAVCEVGITVMMISLLPWNVFSETLLNISGSPWEQPSHRK